MKPVDPRLLRYARATRVFLAASVALGLAGAGLVIAQAMLLATVIVDAFQRGELSHTPLVLLLAVSAGRALVAWLTELAAHRASASVKSELRLGLLRHATALGPARDRRTGELTALATRGVDALDAYFARYLPQLGLAVVVPVAVLARIVTEDWIAAATIAVTLPLIPVFMILIGLATQARMDRQWRLLSRLSGHFLDVVAGLPTLKVFGRAKHQAEQIRAITDDYRRATLRTLRVAFLSSFVLELLSTISVALVAVGIGFRLVDGDLDLYTGLVVLILAPEAYLPLRQVGAQYHAAAEGLAAADQVFTVLDEPVPAHGSTPAPDRPVLRLEGVRVRHEGRAVDSLPATTLTLAPGETLAVVGPSGAGKSTLLHTLLGFARPTEGRVTLDGTDLREVDLPSWHRQVAWVPQHPHLFAGTLADNVRLARPDASEEQVREALRQAAAGELDPRTVLGESGAGLSAGQRQRVALARAFLADRPVLLLDEPTAALDGHTEAAVVEALNRLTAGRTTLLIAHRPALLPLADRVVSLPGPAQGGPERPVAPRWTEAVAHGEAPEPAVRTAVPADVPRGTGDLPGAPPDPAEPGAPRQEAPTAAGAPGGKTGKGRRRPAVPPSRAGARPGAALLRTRHTRRLTLATVLGALALGCAVALMATSGWLISRASEQPPVLYLLVAVTATRAFGIGRAVFRYAERLVSHDAVLRILADLRVRVYRRLERLAPAGLRHTRRGDLLSRLVADVDALQDHVLRWRLPAVVGAVVSLASVGFAAWVLPEAGAALAAGLLLAGVAVPALTGAVSRRTEHRLAPARGVLTTRAVDLLTGTGELTVAGALPARAEAVREADTDLTHLARRSAARTALASGLTTLLTGVTVVAVAGLGAVATAAERLEGVWLAALALAALAAFEAVTGLPQAVQFRQRTARSAQRVQEVLDAPEPVREPDAPVTAELRLPLTLRGLTARHPGADRLALDGFDLDLTPGRRVAVVGPSGSGKTTLAQVLLRFLDPASGSYTFAGGPEAGRLDATACDGDAVRRTVGLCAQDAHVFDSDLRENLRLARPSATDAELHAALAAARLGDWAATLPEGLDTLVGEHGARLSGGQRQRLALARALLADFPVLVLDEPAEHLDLPTADALTADLLDVTAGRTTVLITHRMQGLEAVDEVVVLDEGRVAQRGTYRELAAVDGPFRRMLRREADTADLFATAVPAA